MLIAKVLCIDAKLALPLHKIYGMLSVTTSDSMQVFIVAICIIVDNVLSLISMYAISCNTVHILNTVMQFFGVIKLTDSSLSIVIMSIEKTFLASTEVHNYSGFNPILKVKMNW